MEFELAIYVACAFLVAGAVKGVSGLGLPTVAMGLLSLVMAPSAAAALLVAPSVTTNVLQSFGRRFPRVASELWPMWIAIPAGTFFSPIAPLTHGGPGVRIGLGLLLAIYGLYGLRKPQFTLRGSRRTTLLLSAVAGYATGVLTAATGIFVMPMVVFLQVLSFNKDEMVQALGISFLVCTAALAVSLGWRESLAASLSLPGALALAAALVGLSIGAFLRRFLDLGAFRKVLYTVFVALGTGMVIKGFTL
ncbi:sulfite exporter TauE/SafE family protein [Streptococcus pyogenes]|uniref:sulfite exporter TauE/SafE family protein n=1 Tax=Streptococcus pyogenes TaxID=1314 RepID=UPI003DA0FB68